MLDPLPTRFLSVARHEIDVYDRNRELSFSLRGADLRARLHGFIVRISIPLERLADDHATYMGFFRSGQPFPQHAEELRNEMEATFSYLIKSRIYIPELLATLKPIARNQFDSYSRIDGHGISTGRSA